MDWKFLGRFVLYLSLFFSAGQLPLGLLQDLKVLTASATQEFWAAFALPVSFAGTDVRFFDFPMVITLECTALHYMAVYGAGVLAWRGRSYPSRLAGLAVGIIIIFALNILRIGVLGMVGHYAHGVFEFVHAYLWQGTFALLVLLIWMAWVEGRAMFAGAAQRAIIRAFVATAVSYAIVTLCMEYYAAALSAAADVVFRPLATVIGIAVRAVPEGDMIGYVTQQGVIYNDIARDVLNTVIFCGVAAGSYANSPRRVLLKRIAAGAGLLLLQHLGYVVMYGVMLARGLDAELFSTVLFFTVGASMIAPVLIWLAVSLIFRSAPEELLSKTPS